MKACKNAVSEVQYSQCQWHRVKLLSQANQQLQLRPTRMPNHEQNSGVMNTTNSDIKLEG